VAQQLDQFVCAALNQIGTSLRNETLSRPKLRVRRHSLGAQHAAAEQRVGERVATVRSTAASNLSPRAPALRQPSASCDGLTVMGSTRCCYMGSDFPRRHRRAPGHRMEAVVPTHYG
jgi:hypothetical protein